MVKILKPGEDSAVGGLILCDIANKDGNNLDDYYEKYHDFFGGHEVKGNIGEDA